MKVKFDTPLKTLDGKQFVEKGPDGADVPATLKSIALQALTAILEEDRGLSGEVAFKRLELARKVHKGGELEIDPADAVLIRERAAKIFGIMISGQVYELLK